MNRYWHVGRRGWGKGDVDSFERWLLRVDWRNWWWWGTYHLTVHYEFWSSLILCILWAMIDHRNNSGWWVVDEIFESMHAVVKRRFWKEKGCSMTPLSEIRRIPGIDYWPISPRWARSYVFSGGWRHKALVHKCSAPHSMSASSHSWQSSR